MDMDVALETLNGFYRYKPNELHKHLRLYALALNCVSADDYGNILKNIVNILTKGMVIIMLPIRTGEKYIVKSLPHRRHLLYKYLQQYNFRRSDNELLELLHSQLLENLNIEDDICEILKILNVLYTRHLFFDQRYYLLQVLQKISYNRDKRCHKLISQVLERLLNNHFSNPEKYALLHELFDLSRFGVMEFLISSCLFKVARDVWEHSHIYRLMNYVMQGFADNNLAFAASILFNTIIEMVDDEHIKLVVVILKYSIEDRPKESSRTLMQSFTKYMVPICAKRFRSELVDYSTDMDLCYRLIICKHISIAKRFLKNRCLLTNIIAEASRSKDSQEMADGFQLLCHFHSKKVYVTKNDVNLFKKMLPNLPEMTPAIKRSIRQFISQICVNFICTANRQTFTIHLDFYRWLYDFLYANIFTQTHFAEIVAEVYCYSMEALVRPSSHLVTHYYVRPLYEHNPLYATLFNQYGRYFDYIVIHCFNILMRSTKPLPVPEKCLMRILHQPLGEDMAFMAYHHFFDILPLNLPWANVKSVKWAAILVRSLIHTNKVETLRIFRDMISNIINEKVERFRNPNADADINEFAIYTQVEVLTMLMENPIVIQDYITEGTTAAANITLIIVPYCNHTKENFDQLKTFKKNIERTIISLMNHTVSAAKLAGYPLRLLGTVLNMVGDIINFVPLKKLIVDTCKRFHEMVKDTPRFNDRYIHFYNAQKFEFMQDDEAEQMSLRQSAGVRNVLHVLLKAIDKPYFLESEIVDFFTNDTPVTIDQLNLRLNLLECLIADADLKQRTKKYVVPIFEFALKHLNHPSSIIKNSSVLLIAAITTRLLGPLSEGGIRELSAFDIFITNDALTEMISEYLFDPFDTSIDVKICILGFLCESNRDGHLYNLPCPFELDRLRMFFTDELLCDYAISAYISCVPTNSLFAAVTRLFQQLDFGDENALRLTNEVELVMKLVKRYVEAFPEGEKTDLIIAESDKVLKICESEEYMGKQVEKVAFTFKKLECTPKEVLEDNEDELFRIPDEVNYNYLSCLLQYVNNKCISSKVDFHFVEVLINYLLNAENVPIEFIFCARDVAMNVLKRSVRSIENVQMIKFIKPLELIDINIQELYATFICKKEVPDENDFIVLNNILQNSIKLFAIPRGVGKAKTVVNIMENVTRFLFRNKINIPNYLLMLYILTYTSEEIDEKLSKLYYFLTAGTITAPKCGLFLTLNNLDLYLEDKRSQRELLTSLLEFSNRAVDFDYSCIYSDPTVIIDKVNFQLKLSENVLYLLHS